MSEAFHRPPANPVRFVRPEDLTLHPDMERIIPAMPDEQYRDFAADVKARGVQRPLETAPGTNQLVDGRTRRRAALDGGVAQVPVQDAELLGDSPVVYMLRVSLLRRHVTDDQRAAMGAELLEQLETEAKAKQKKGGETAGRGRAKPAQEVGASVAPSYSAPAPKRAPRSAEIAAEKVGSTRRKVTAAAEVKAKAPVAFAKVKAGELSLKQATKEVKAKEEPKPAPVKKPDPAPFLSTVKTPDLLPCPFCGAVEGWLKAGDHRVTCMACFTQGPTGAGIVGAAKEWNKRETKAKRRAAK